MLQITVPAREFFNDETQEFITYPEVSLKMEHSLLSLSQWESKWEKPFLELGNRTKEETAYYFKCMTLSPELPTDFFRLIPDTVNDAIIAYIESKQTATFFTKNQPGFSRQKVTSELIYYWMVSLNIPFECETWHLNRLTTLIRVCNEQAKPEKGLKGAALAKRNSELNAARRAQLNSKG